MMIGASLPLYNPRMQLDSAIFKAYDIRGVVPQTLNPSIAKALGRAFGTHAQRLGECVVAVGRDGRLSGPSLAQALIDGLVEAGIDVIDIGMVTTPMLYFAAHTLCQSGIQITGSHNPKDYNGFKMVLGGRAIYGDEILGLRDIMRDETWQLRDGGQVRTHDVSEAYRAHIVNHVRLSRPMKIVVDSGNGIAGATAPAIFRELGCDVIELFSEVDGHFPNHHPDPSKLDNLNDLIHALQHSDAELGLAFDGDGDRLGIVTKDGQIIFPDRQMSSADTPTPARFSTHCPPVAPRLKSMCLAPKVSHTESAPLCKPCWQMAICLLHRIGLWSTPLMVCASIGKTVSV